MKWENLDVSWAIKAVYRYVNWDAISEIREKEAWCEKWDARNDIKWEIVEYYHSSFSSFSIDDSFAHQVLPREGISEANIIRSQYLFVVIMVKGMKTHVRRAYWTEPNCFAFCDACSERQSLLPIKKSWKSWIWEIKCKWIVRNVRSNMWKVRNKACDSWYQTGVMRMISES